MTKDTKRPKQFDARNPLESFDPRYRDFLRHALTSELRLEFETPGEARHFQTRLQMYRKKLLEAHDPEARSFYKLKTSRKDHVLTISPADAKFDNLLSQFSSRVPHVENAPRDERIVEDTNQPVQYYRNDDIPAEPAAQEITLEQLFADLQINEKDEPDVND